MSGIVRGELPPLPDPYAGMTLHERHKAQRIEQEKREGRWQQAVRAAQRMAQLTDGTLTFRTGDPCPSCGQAFSGVTTSVPPFCFCCRQSVGGGA